jgi:hypothetical protein
MNHYGLSTNDEAAPQGGWRFVAFLKKYGTLLWLIFLFASFVPKFYVRTEYNAPFQWAFKFLSVPVVIACLWVGLRNKQEFQARSRGPASFWIGLILFPLLIILGCSGVATALNMAIPPQTPIVLRGMVTNKFVTHGRNSTTYVVVVSGSLGVRKLEMSQGEYDATEIGAPFSQERIMGPLGFTYIRKR